jgi:L,D-peptidoglycan transpeptidase YkuD (ErfK/YbiS/YcfS/YnhG family)
MATLKDWTNGCIAVSDEEMDEIWATVKNGTKIKIKE